MGFEREEEIRKGGGLTESRSLDLICQAVEN